MESNGFYGNVESSFDHTAKKFPQKAETFQSMPESLSLNVPKRYKKSFFPGKY